MPDRVRPQIRPGGIHGGQGKDSVDDECGDGFRPMLAESVQRDQQSRQRAEDADGGGKAKKDGREENRE